jgi:hypothetical protein
MTDIVEDLYRKIKVLNEQIWESRATVPQIERWLENYTGAFETIETERQQALFLLSHFMYFGDKETRELLRSLYRDSYKYPIIRSIRQEAGDTDDVAFIEQRFEGELLRTRFLGVGNPAESGTHLLYYYRQENELHKSQFINSHEIFTYSSTSVSLRDPQIVRYVFIDDLAGSGTQAHQYSKSLVETIKKLKPDARVSYHVMFATSEALTFIRANTSFDDVSAVFTLDPSFKCFDSTSRYFRNEAPATHANARSFAEYYGRAICSGHPLGFKAGQLLLGFHHNTPDNTLPIFWVDTETPPWHPIFRRYPKIEW